MLEKKEMLKTIQKTVKLDYLLYHPKNYEDDMYTVKKYPLIIFLHGAGERGSDVEDVKKHGIPKNISENTDYDFIVAAPQCPANKWWTMLEDEFISFVNEIIANNRVDTSRIYLTGLSMGGFGTWCYGMKYPQTFAALAPVCGGFDGADFPEKDLIPPIWVFHGAKDDVVAFSCSTEPVRTLNDMNLKTDVKFTVYPELKHDSWTDTYDNPALYEWFLTKTNENYKPIEVN